VPLRAAYGELIVTPRVDTLAELAGVPESRAARAMSATGLKNHSTDDVVWFREVGFRSLR
jgi:hypothetical protein